MAVTARTAIALVLTLGWGCDYTPDLPPAPPSPKASAVPSGSSSIPVIVVPVPAQTPLPVVPSPVPPDSYATRLDRDDNVYVANSVARFRTGPWEWRVPPLACGRGSSSFSTQYVFYATGPNRPDQGYNGQVAVSWNFVAR